MTDLIAFITEQLRDDECHALNAFRDYGDDGGDAKNGPEWFEIWSGTVQCGPQGEHVAAFDSGLSRHIVQHDPARALRQVEAGRRILARHCPDTPPYIEYCNECENTKLNECPELRDLAFVYSDAPGYRDEWRP